MGSKGYKPVPTVTYEKQDDASNCTAIETRCGILSLRPSVMQPCANMCCFTAFYGMTALLTSTLTSYVNSQVTTLERQFGFTSKQTGLIMAANDIGFLMCVLFISYSSARIHIPRSLGIATITFGISGLACSLPHFIFGARVDSETTATGAANRTLVRSSIFGDLCDVNNITSASCDSSLWKSSSQMSEHVATVSLVIIVIGMMLQGFGKAPRVSLVVTYVDNNTKRTNTGLFMGVIVTLAILGPAAAYTMGALFSRMYVTLEATNLTPKHPKWIGAWWLGYVVFGILSLLISIPLFCFPRKLPQRHRATPVDVETVCKSDIGLGDAHSKHIAPSVAAKQTNGTGEHHVQTRFNARSIIQELKGFLSVLARLWGNPIYACTVISSCLVLFTVSAVNSYTPKYMERMFNLPAYKANYIMAVKSLCASCIGTFAGGYLTKKLKMTAIKALLFITVAIGLSFACTVAAMFFQCEQPTVHNWPGSPESCYDECNCKVNKYFPICGQDGRTYYSPCTAGCTDMVNEVYQNCSCIAGGTAVGGTCDYGCNHVYAYSIFSALRSVTGTSGIVPKIILIIRCVEDRDKGFAMGMQAFMTSLFGWLLGPIIIGYVIDGICEVWDVACGTTGRCLLYDNDVFRIKLHSYCAVSLSCSLVVLISAYIYARLSGCLDDKGLPPKAEDSKATTPNALSVNANYGHTKDPKDFKESVEKNGKT